MAVLYSPQDRVDLLERVTREHERFQADVDELRLWLQAVVAKVNGCAGRSCSLPAGPRLSALQVTGRVHRGPLGSLHRFSFMSRGSRGYRVQTSTPTGPT